jgi:hypothetical protein
MMACGGATGLTDVLMNARVATLENERKLHLMNLCHAAYLRLCGRGLGTGAMRGAGWLDARLGHGHDRAAAGAPGPHDVERDGTIHGLRGPRTARRDIWA